MSPKFLVFLFAAILMSVSLVGKAASDFKYDYINMPDGTSQIGAYLKSSTIEERLDECRIFATDFAKMTTSQQLYYWFPNNCETRRKFSGEKIYNELSFSYVFAFKIFEQDESNPRYANIFFYDFAITKATDGPWACILRDNGSAPNAAVANIQNLSEGGKAPFLDKALTKVFVDAVKNKDKTLTELVLGYPQESIYLGHTPESEYYWELTGVKKDFSEAFTVKLEMVEGYYHLRTLNIKLDHQEAVSSCD